MPYRPGSPCKERSCPSIATKHGYCDAHQSMAHHADDRPSFSQRGYDSSWRRLRIEILKHYRIPVSDWHLYDIHHDPVYDPDKDPVHEHYTLTPILHSAHSAHTAKHDHGFGNRG
jgi:hypothetical protein